MSRKTSETIAFSGKRRFALRQTWQQNENESNSNEPKCSHAFVEWHTAHCALKRKSGKFLQMT